MCDQNECGQSSRPTTSAGKIAIKRTNCLEDTHASMTNNRFFLRNIKIPSKQSWEALKWSPLLIVDYCDTNNFYAKMKIEDPIVHFGVALI